jgi:hypothetical protein
MKFLAMRFHVSATKAGKKIGSRAHWLFRHRC